MHVDYNGTNRRDSNCLTAKDNDGNTACYLLAERWCYTVETDGLNDFGQRNNEPIRLFSLRQKQHTNCITACYKEYAGR